MFYFFVVVFFNAEFKENGNHNNPSSIPVSMPSPLTAYSKIIILSLLLVALVLHHIFLWRQELGVQVGLVKDEFLLGKMRETTEVRVGGRDQEQGPPFVNLSVLIWGLLRERHCKPHKGRAHARTMLAQCLAPSRHLISICRLCLSFLLRSLRLHWGVKCNCDLYPT